MPPAPTPPPPRVLFKLLSERGYKLLEETPYNWVMSLGDDDEPVIIPKRGMFVSFELMHRLKLFGGIGYNPTDEELYADYVDDDD